MSLEWPRWQKGETVTWDEKCEVRKNCVMSTRKRGKGIFKVYFNLKLKSYTLIVINIGTVLTSGVAITVA